MRSRVRRKQKEVREKKHHQYVCALLPLRGVSLQLRRADRRTVACRRFHVQSAWRARGAQVGVVEKQKGEQQAYPSMSCPASGGRAESELAWHFIYNSWTASRGQGDASAALPLAEGEKGIGARGAPIPVVGRGPKIKLVECRSPGSRLNEGPVNSP